LTKQPIEAVTLSDALPSTVEAEVIPIRTRMTELEYDAERAKLAPDKAAAGIRWEHGLASLFYRSGWTQDELAKKEGKGKSWISQRLIFGRFLAFAANSTTVEKFTERRFRSYWERTAEHGSSNERIRFKAVLDLMAAEEPMRVAHIPKGYPKRIVEKFADSKWHSLSVIAKHLDAPEEEVERSLATMVKDGRGNAKTETKKVGTVKHYKFYRNERMISSHELTDKLSPILDGLEAEGKKSMATMSPTAVAILAHKLRQLLKDWVE
jgi:hypothetical protein